MANLEIEHSAESRVPPASIWSRYTDVEEWPEWSKGVEESSLDGEFEVGSKGMAKPPHLPKTSFELIEVEPERRFTSEAKMIGGTLRLEHMIEPTDGGTRITHRATLAGPLDFLWAPLVGRIVERELRPSVERLAELAVKKEEEERREAEEKEKKDARLEKADEQFREEIKKTSSGEGDRGGASVPGNV